MNLENTTQRDLLRHLMWVSDITYAQLHKHFEKHELFNYHLRELVSQGYILKEGSKYKLSSTGRQKVSFMDEDGSLQQQFKVSMAAWVVRLHEGKWQTVMFTRKKHPQLGWKSIITGKMKYGESTDDCLARELFEEVGIIPTAWALIDVSRVFVKDEQGTLRNDLIIYSHVVTEWQNNIVLSGIEGEYFWQDINTFEQEVHPTFNEGYAKWLPGIRAYLANPSQYNPRVLFINPERMAY